MEIVYGANIKDHINVIFQNLQIFILGDLLHLKVEQNDACCISNILYRSTVLYIRTNLKAMSVSVVGSH